MLPKLAVERTRTPHINSLRFRKKKRNLFCLLLLGAVFMVIELFLIHFQLGIHVHQIPTALAGYLSIHQECLTPEQDMKSLEKLLLDFSTTLEANNITYWIDFGTLLGAVRHKAIIPWDNDLDVGIYAKDYDTVHRLLTESGYEPRFWHERTKIKVVHRGMPMDIFGWEEDGAGNLNRFGIPLKENLLFYTFPQFYINQPLQRYTMKNFSVFGPHHPETLIPRRFPYSYKISLPRKFRCYFVYKEYFFIVLGVALFLFSSIYFTCRSIYYRIPV
eukprot:Sdes_comp17259_c0_seq1m6452